MQFSGMAVGHGHSLRSTPCHAIVGLMAVMTRLVARGSEKGTKTRANKGYSLRKWAIREAVLGVVEQQLGSKEKQQPMEWSKNKQPIGEEGLGHCCPDSRWDQGSKEAKKQTKKDMEPRDSKKSMVVPVLRISRRDWDGRVPSRWVDEHGVCSWVCGPRLTTSVTISPMSG